jgi:hypothetical protein
MRNFIICTHPQISLRKSSQGEWGGRGMWHAWERRENCTRCWWESPKERDHWEDQGVGGRMGSEWILRRLAWGVCGLDSTGSGHRPVAGCLLGRVVSPTPNPQAGGPPTVGCPQLLIHYIHSYPPYLEAVSSIRNPKTRYAVVTVDLLNMDVIVNHPVQFNGTSVITDINQDS